VIALGMEPRLSICQHSSSDIPMLRPMLVTGGPNSYDVKTEDVETRGCGVSRRRF
jgi:hypothetical protein